MLRTVRAVPREVVGILLALACLFGVVGLLALLLTGTDHRKADAVESVRQACGNATAARFKRALNAQGDLRGSDWREESLKWGERCGPR